MAPVIDVRDLRMRYGDKDVLTGVDFTVQAGSQVQAAKEAAVQWVR